VQVIISGFFAGGEKLEILVRHPWMMIGPVVLAAVRRIDQASSL
jgi:hypothetical protein